ncbi:G2/mitotic-specific cyclin-B2-like [Sinocyclocheilus rhinocerous]|uniref:G2/mitotic-specific cyclin-B2-like n=1 Tax=Sinocyclocheilus rhinocerous TaxID=307959 RepID=UPI0007B8D8B0|nr:PREDICTED: G2/mitotic-specific cyclin-B2-like [Sinocyclocheilus rhinocerous]
MEIHALRNANNPVFIGGKGGPVNGAARRAVFGELSNFNVTHKPVQTKKVQPVLPVKPIAVAQPKRSHVQHEIPQPAPALPPAQADVSMKVEELCQAFSNTLFPVEDIDEGDADMPQLCPEYVKDIYAYLRSLESKQSVRPLYMRGYDINGRMRALLVDWLIQVHSRFQLLQETLYMTVAILDRFLQVQPVTRKKLQLVGVTAMLIACKYEEMYVPMVGDFAYIVDDAFTKAQIREMEILFKQWSKFSAVFYRATRETGDEE